jgi:hypothetical protein
MQFSLLDIFQIHISKVAFYGFVLVIIKLSTPKPPAPVPIADQAGIA